MAIHRILLSCLFLMAFFRWAFAQDTEKSFRGVTFTIPTPITVKEISYPGQPGDFTLLSFCRGKQEIMFCYLGNAPEFPSKDDAKVTTEKVGDTAYQSVRYRGEDGKYRRDILLTFPHKLSEKTARYAHLFYTEANPGDTKTVRRIITTFKKK
ncbi:MAG: hypothetical protein H7Y38_04415 [Armatimonadetes bacterium]|nr:hypothetical protein [Armatimonadota bacterium]